MQDGASVVAGLRLEVLLLPLAENVGWECLPKHEHGTLLSCNYLLAAYAQRGVSGQARRLAFPVHGL